METSRGLILEIFEDATKLFSTSEVPLIVDAVSILETLCRLFMMMKMMSFPMLSGWQHRQHCFSCINTHSYQLIASYIKLQLVGCYPISDENFAYFLFYF
ncbi:hypothetical protein L208DRAFT_1515562, partial [Tricholoma matsutake]